MQALLIFMHMMILIMVGFQYVTYRSILKTNELLHDQINCDKKMMDNLSQSVISISKENSKLRNDNSELKKTNEALSEKMKKMNEKISSFSSMFKGNA
jgi:peptidoglycan hydrolase CwlO-like protein